MFDGKFISSSENCQLLEKVLVLVKNPGQSLDFFPDWFVLIILIIHDSICQKMDKSKANELFILFIRLNVLECIKEDNQNQEVGPSFSNHFHVIRIRLKQSLFLNMFRYTRLVPTFGIWTLDSYIVLFLHPVLVCCIV